jgi:hypothetical protein
MAIRAATFVALLVFSLPYARDAAAETIQDGGFWFMLAAQGGGEPVSDRLSRFRWWFDIQPRLTGSAGGAEQTLIRPGLGYQIADNVSIWLGYAWIRSEAGGLKSTENRIWQQLSWSPEVKWFKLSSRTRLEQRFIVGRGDVGWRLRQFVKLKKPILPRARIFVAAYDEVMFDLNATTWGQRAGFAQNRLFAGLGWSVDAGSRVSVELGYLNQFLSRSVAADRMNHILSLNLFLNL